MGSGQSSAKAAEAQEPDTGTQLFGSWDKPVAEAYAKKASKKGKAVAAGAANAALGSLINLEAGAGVKPTGKSKTPGKQKGAGTTACPPGVIAHNSSCPVSCPWLHFSSLVGLFYLTVQVFPRLGSTPRKGERHGP